MKKYYLPIGFLLALCIGLSTAVAQQIISTTEGHVIIIQDIPSDKPVGTKVYTRGFIFKAPSDPSSARSGYVDLKTRKTATGIVTTGYINNQYIHVKTKASK